MIKSKLGSLDELIGKIEEITYSDNVSGFTIAKVQPVGQRRSVTVMGHIINPTPGTTLSMKGQWNKHPEFGLRFKAIRIHTRAATTTEGVGKYLSSGLIKSVGQDTAVRIVERFKEKALDVIAHQPERLSEIPGLEEKQIARIKKAWQQQKMTYRVMIFLQNHGVPQGYAFKIFRQYGHRTIDLLRKNPYRLSRDIFGIGFSMADKMAAKLGYENENPQRIEAGILYLLRRLADEGHLYFPYEALIVKSQSVLQAARNLMVGAIGVLSAKTEIVIEELDEKIHRDQPNPKAVYLRQYCQYEKLTAQQIHMLIKAPPKISIPNVYQAIQWIQKYFKLKLVSGQQKAIAKALTTKVLLITGGPGTGKAAVVHAIVRLYEHLHARIMITAPTNRASKHLSETIGRQVKTIHQFLEYHPRKAKFQKNQHNPFEEDIIVINKAEMIDMALMYHFLKAVPATASLIIVGDANQLPSAGPGNVLKDLIASQAIAQIRLNEILQQAHNSRIIVNAHRINAGKLPQIEPIQDDILGDFYFIPQKDPEKVLSIILTLVSQWIPQRFGFDSIDDIQVLTPMHRGITGAKNLNQQLQQTLNPQKAHFNGGEQQFGLHDKVMQVCNNYEKNIFNGDIGRIAQINASAKTATICFDDRMISYEETEMDELVLAYATSVHKSQRSEYPAVVIPVTTEHHLLLQRNLIYTGFARAKQLIILVGTEEALSIAVENNAPYQQYTRLAHRLRTLSSMA